MLAAVDAVPEEFVPVVAIPVLAVPADAVPVAEEVGTDGTTYRKGDEKKSSLETRA